MNTFEVTKIVWLIGFVLMAIRFCFIFIKQMRVEKYVPADKLEVVVLLGYFLFSLSWRASLWFVYVSAILMLYAFAIYKWLTRKRRAKKAMRDLERAIYGK